MLAHKKLPAEGPYRNTEHQTSKPIDLKGTFKGALTLWQMSICAVQSYPEPPYPPNDVWPGVNPRLRLLTPAQVQGVKECFFEAIKAL